MDILVHKTAFTRLTQLNQLSDENQVLFFRYMLQVITLALLNKKYVNYCEPFNLGKPLPNFHEMLQMNPMDFKLIVKQVYAFAQSNNTIELLSQDQYQSYPADEFQNYRKYTRFNSHRKPYCNYRTRSRGGGNCQTSHKLKISPFGVELDLAQYQLIYIFLYRLQKVYRNISLNLEDH